MTNKSEEQVTTPRPLAVWFALGILFFYIPIVLLGISLPSESDSVLDERDFSDVVIDAVELAAIFFSWVIAFWAIAVRKQWGRWLVAASVAYLTGVTIWDHLVLPELLVEEPYDRTDLFVGAVFGLAPLVLVVLLVSFGANVKEYFSGSQESQNPDEL